ncbi:MAG: beta-N-acetylhexosaminidase [Bacteroidales bacterium]|nr:beta-N-acetylhexosaminidase [Bacteroidales bacterium]
MGKYYENIRVIEQRETAAANIIHARYDSLIDNPEAYRLEVSGDAITIEAGNEAGVFYAFQTLMQLIWPSQQEIRGEIAIPCVAITDKPQYRWRGMHLDVSRHFFPKEFIFKMLDAMAMHKLNTFHWHLTDDQGWRIEIDGYPELASVAAWRDETLIGHGSETPWVYDGKRYGGYYTKEDVREVVEYAARLHINVLPEIEMPGHAVAALQAYPQLSCTGGPVPPFNRWGVSEDVFCPGREETFEFLEGVLSEVAELFPYEYIHIGGDECPKVRWQQCDLCQERIAENGLKDEHELQSWFIKRIEAFLASKGKKIIGWDEILEGGIADNAAVMSWRGHSGGIQAANMGHDVVMTPHSFVYLDYYQSKYNEPLAIGGMLDMRKVYSIDIMPPEIEEEKKKHIIGAQVNVWTEYMADEQHVEYMVFPRLAALAEALWTPASRLDYDDFTTRMNSQYARYDAMGIGYRVPYPHGYDAINLVTDGMRQL